MAMLDGISMPGTLQRRRGAAQQKRARPTVSADEPANPGFRSCLAGPGGASDAYPLRCMRALSFEKGLLGLLVGLPGCAGAARGTSGSVSSAQHGSLAVDVVEGGAEDAQGDAPVVTTERSERVPTERPAPARDVLAGQAVRAVSVGSGLACARTEQGGVWCWRPPGRDEPAPPSDAEAGEPRPARVPSLPAVRSVAVGGGFACAVDVEGRVWCWGRAPAEPRFSHRSGTEAPRAGPFTAVAVSGLPTVRSVIAAPDHVCALGVGGALYCWGHNDYGQLGDGTARSRARPVRVASLPVVVSAAAGPRNTCALTPHGELFCWGDNDYRQLAPCASGIRWLRARRVRFEVPAAAQRDASTLTRLAVGDAEVCALRSDGALAGCDSRVQREHLGGLAQLAVGPSGEHCALRTDGELRCWGMSGAGCARENLGFGPGGFDCLPHGGRPGDTIRCRIPADLPSLRGSVQVSVGEGAACAVQPSGALWCWPMHRPQLRAATGQSNASVAWEVVPVPYRVSPGATP